MSATFYGYHFTELLREFMTALFASASYGFEELLKAELEALGAQNCRIVAGGVHYQADHSTVYQSLLWSRLASRILLPLKTVQVHSEMDVYLAARVIDWQDVFLENASFMVQFYGTNAEIRHSQFGALRVKDGIVDSFTSKNLPRPVVNKDTPEVLIHVWLQKNQLSISLDLSGGGLHQRGYRKQAGMAPIKETLAFAIVLRSGWQPGSPLIDPMCGSGTLLIEAAMLACDQAPGLLRQGWGFQGWLQHDEGLWQSLKKQAQQRADNGRAAYQGQFWGVDHDVKIIDIAKVNARRAGLDELIQFSVCPVADLRNPIPDNPPGLIISNPPYGERLASEPALIALHNQLGRVLKREFSGWKLSLFSATPNLLSCLQLRAQRQFKAKNGALDCLQKNYLLTQSVSVQDCAGDYANRLRKNVKKWDKWAKRQGVDCYRLYDADLPDYNLALDRYGDFLVMQEYAPPKTIDANKARRRLLDAMSATLDVLNLPASRLVLKTRERQKGASQYQKMGQQGRLIEVREYQARLLVNLTDYLDTGLFPDHRLVRCLLGKMAGEKDFLNLFAYTGSASVHAGLAGACSTTTVDMSRTYLEWAERNLQLNGLSGRRHRLIQADCMGFLQQNNEQFDVIFLDPPTFSNSKRMALSFEVQRDHLSLLEQLKPLLRQAGCIVFSNNKRGFRLDEAGLSRMGLIARDISRQTLCEDFARRANLHHCWILTHAEGLE